MADYAPELTEAEKQAMKAKEPVYIYGDDGKVQTYIPNGDGTYYRRTITGGQMHDSEGNVKVYHRSHVTNSDGDLEDVFVEASRYS